MLMLTEFYYKGKLIKSKKPFTIFPPPKGTIIAIIGIGLSRLFGNWILLTISIYFIIEVLYTLKERKQAKEKYLQRRFLFIVFLHSIRYSFQVHLSVILLFFFLSKFFFNLTIVIMEIVFLPFLSTQIITVRVCFFSRTTPVKS